MRGAVALILGWLTIGGAAAAPPNVLIVMADDLAFGDLGIHGNPVVKTPRLDAFARRSAQLQQFYAQPVCSPTRASLMCGRSHYRTGIVDTYQGRSILRAGELTLGELFKGSGYRTGLFGKWHLGDCPPFRPGDQGFLESLVHRGGGLSQNSDVPGGTGYADPTLLHNGVEKKYAGYCTDIFTDAAIGHIESAVSAKKPFFTFVGYNCPHTPLQVRDVDTAPYKGLRLSPASFPQAGFPITRPMPADDLIKLYGMISTIDTSFGKLLDTLEKLKVADDTVIVFLSDNGPQQPRYNAGLRGLKGTCYEGGIRVPCFMRLGSKLKPGLREAPASVLDLVPTLCAATGIAKPSDRPLDGVDLWPYLTGGKPPADRTLYFQWHRGDAPQQFRAFAARGPRFKLVQPEFTDEKPWSGPGPFQLFDLLKDPYEQTDVAGSQRGEVDTLKAGYEKWFAEVTKAGFAAPKIALGSSPVRLTRQDWRGATATARGHWEVTNPADGTYDISVILPKGSKAAKVQLQYGSVSATAAIEPGKESVELSGVKFPAGAGKLDVFDDAGQGVWQLIVTKAK